MKNINSIEIVESITRENFEKKYVLPNKPVIIRNCLKNWAASKKWNFAYLKEKIGHIEVCYKKSLSNIHPDFRKQAAHTNSTFNAYIELLQSSNKTINSQYFLSGDELYFNTAEVINDSLAVLREDFEYLPYFDIKNITKTGLWLSTQGVTSWLHYDGKGVQNLNAQIIGSKHVKLYNPNLSKNLYMYLDTQSELYNFSQINILNPDFNQYPNFKNIAPVEATLEAGDVLYIPAYWIHSFSHLSTENININFWWKTEVIKNNSLLLREKFIELFHEIYSKQDHKFNQANIKDLFNKFELEILKL